MNTHIEMPSQISCAVTDKPMSISTIVQPTIPPSQLTESPNPRTLFAALSIDKSPYPRHSNPSYYCPSPPISPQQPEFTASPSFQSHSSHTGSLPSAMPLTLHERRLRNKAASAKYRQKKNQQQHEMQTVISRLTKHNAVLEQHVHELRKENERLRATTDRLRGKMVAEKMLKQWMNRQRKENAGLQSFPGSPAAIPEMYQAGTHELACDTGDEHLTPR